LDERLRSFVEGATRARVETSARVGSGASRVTWLVSCSDGAERVLRVDSGDGPMAGTELTLAREAAVYAALGGGSVAIPRLLAVAPGGDALLVERAPGVDSLASLDAPGRARVMDAYVDALATLHGLDTARLALPGFARPEPEDPARAELALWRGVLELRVKRPAPLARFAFGWLERHAPGRADRIALCHGDVGPGNFLHESGRVTALLDWEFAHLGDPLDDLAWLAFRGHHLNDGIGELAAQLRRWSRATGLPAAAERIGWYRALVMLRMLVSCLAALDSGAATLDRTVYFSLAALLGALLPRALAELAGIAELTGGAELAGGAPGEPPAPPDAAPGEEAEVLASVLADLSGVLLPALPAAQQARARGLALLLLHLQAADRYGPVVREAEREALARALGRAVEPGEAPRALEARVRETPPAEEEQWIRFFAETGARRIAFWPFLAPLAAKPFARLEA
jgi:aminoglycoside phosphotransferase (APT) family kinase protein